MKTSVIARAAQGNRLTNSIPKFDELLPDQHIRNTILESLYSSIDISVITMVGGPKLPRTPHDDFETAHSFAKSKDEFTVLVTGFGVCLSFLSAYK
jgi:hypothetical protein